MSADLKDDISEVIQEEGKDVTLRNFTTPNPTAGDWTEGDNKTPADHVIKAIIAVPTITNNEGTLVTAGEKKAYIDLSTLSISDYPKEDSLIIDGNVNYTIAQVIEPELQGVQLTSVLVLKA